VKPILGDGGRIAAFRGEGPKDLASIIGKPVALLSIWGSNGSEPVDISTVARMPSLVGIDLWKTGIKDISPLAGMRLRGLRIGGGSVDDLSPLAGMPLKTLSLWSIPATDLSPLKGMRLESLTLVDVAVSDLSPLAGMPLERLKCDIRGATGLLDLAPLKGAPLKRLDLRPSLRECRLGAAYSTRQVDLTPLAGMPLSELYIDVGLPAIVTDVSALDGMRLRKLALHENAITGGMEAIRAMEALESINGHTSEDFWRRYDSNAPTGSSPGSNTGTGVPSTAP
jgi:hypothetical protein